MRFLKLCLNTSTGIRVPSRMLLRKLSNSLTGRAKDVSRAYGDLPDSSAWLWENTRFMNPRTLRTCAQVWRLCVVGHNFTALVWLSRGCTHEGSLRVNQRSAWTFDVVAR
jgi:hypothetical protein